MKLTPSITALAAVMGLALASIPVTLQAQTTATTTAATAPAVPAAPTKVKKAKKTEYSGNLTAIDTTANTITVASTSKLLTLSIAPTTKFKIDKKMATMADFAIGDKVTGSYTKDATGTMTASSVHKTTLMKSAKTAASSATTSATSAVNSAMPATPTMPAGQ